MRRAGIVACCLIILSVMVPGGAIAAPPAVTPAEKAAAYVRPSTVYIEMYFQAWVRIPDFGLVNEGQPFKWASRCSGFLVSPDGYVATAGHCLDLGREPGSGAAFDAIEFAAAWLAEGGIIDPSEIDQYVNIGLQEWGVEGELSQEAPIDLEVYVQRGVAIGGQKTGEAKLARVVEVLSLSKGDVGLLKIEGSDLPSLDLAPDADVRVGTEVFSVGYPASTDDVTDAQIEPTFKSGTVNSRRTREGGTLPVYEIDAAVSGGMSGGPTVDHQGRVVGINSFNRAGETEAFNFIAPSATLKEVLAGAGVQAARGPTDTLYREGLDLYFAGDGKKALEKFNAVLDEQPTHELATEYKKLATDLAATQGGSPLMLILIIVGAVVVLGGGGFAVMRGRRKPALATAGMPAPAGSFPPAAQAPQPEPFTPSQTPAQPVPEAPAQPVTQAPSQPVGFQAPPVTTPPVTTPPVTTPTPEVPAQQVPTAMVPPAPQAAAQRFCDQCGTSMDADARFCPKCGHAV